MKKKVNVVSKDSNFLFACYSKALYANVNCLGPLEPISRKNLSLDSKILINTISIRIEFKPII